MRTIVVVNAYMKNYYYFFFRFIMLESEKDHMYLVIFENEYEKYFSSIYST